MPLDRYTVHRSAVATPAAKEQELRYIRIFCLFFGSIALIEAAVSRSLVPLALIAPCALLEIATHLNGDRRITVLTTTIVAAILGECTQVISILVLHRSRIAGLIVGAMVIWAAVRARKLAKSLPEA